MPNPSPNDPSPRQPDTVPRPMMPVLKPLSKEEASAVAETVPAPDAERRAADAIATVQSESFRRQVREEDAAMAGDLNVLMRKPAAARTIVGVLLLVGFVMIRYAQMEHRAARRTAAEATPAPLFVGQPAPADNFSAQPRHVAPPPPQYNPAFDQRLRRPGYPVSNGAPGMPTGPNPAIAPYLDPYGNPRRPEGYPQPDGGGGGDQEIVNGILRRQEDNLLRRQEGIQPGEPTRQIDPQAQAQTQWQLPPAFPENQPAPPQPHQPQLEPGYSPSQSVPAEPVPPFNPPPPGGTDNGGFPPR